MNTAAPKNPEKRMLIPVAKTQVFTFKHEFFSFYELYLTVEWFIYFSYFICIFGLNCKLSI